MHRKSAAWELSVKAIAAAESVGMARSAHDNVATKKVMLPLPTERRTIEAGRRRTSP